MVRHVHERGGQGSTREGGLCSVERRIPVLAVRAGGAQGCPGGRAAREGQAQGVRARRVLLEAEGGTVSSGQAAELLGITPQAVDKRRRAGKLLALPVGRAYLYPVWQFDERGRGGVLQGLEEVLGSFGVEDAWMRVSFFLRQYGRLGDKRPLDVLRDGEIEA